MFGRIAAFVLALVSTSPLKAMTPDPAAAYAQVLNGPASENELFTAYGVLRSGKCTSIACASVNDIIDAIDHLVERDLPNTMTYLNPRLYDRYAGDRNADRILRAHPERNPYRCAVLTKLARNATPGDRWQPEDSPRFMFEVLDIASRIRIGKRICLTTILATLPHTGAAREMVRRARDFCRHERYYPCSRVRLP